MGDLFDTVEFLGKVPGAQAVLFEIILAVVAAVAVYLWLKTYSEGDDWRRARRLLVEPKRDTGFAPLSMLYRRTLTRFLDWLDGRLNPEAVARGDAETAWSRAWGWRLYDRCLLLSLLYPILFVVLQWGLSDAGTPGRIGELIVFEAEASRFTRIATLGFLCLMFAYFVKREWLMARLRNAAGIFGAEPLLAAKSADWAYLVIAFSIAVAAAIASIGVVAFAVAITVTVTVTVTVSGFVAVSGTGVVAFAAAIASSFAFPGTGIVIGAFVGAFTLILLFDRVHTRRPINAYAILIVVLTITYYFLLTSGTFDSLLSRTAILFYGLLPLVNAQFDFLSLVATRKLLRRGLEGRPVLYSLLDIAIAGLCFLALCLSAVALAVGANALSGVTLIDLPAVFAAPGEHGWLFVAFLTTLLPTLAHMALVVFSFGVARPKRIRHWCAAKLEAHHVSGASAGDARSARLLIAGMAGMCVLFCTLAVHGIVVLAALHGENLGTGLLCILEWWHAILTGAPYAGCR